MSACCYTRAVDMFNIHILLTIIIIFDADWSLYGAVEPLMFDWPFCINDGSNEVCWRFMSCGCIGSLNCCISWIGSLVDIYYVLNDEIWLCTFLWPNISKRRIYVLNSFTYITDMMSSTWIPDYIYITVHDTSKRKKK